ncbi:M48 family metallopeptidase [Halobacterium jilantaiense]|uniref:STE24 endopeptidase n=1 Tax=Halobacterium jilantaiense TaxID=355548 RepID=A0A1I0NWX1_9EURY|nr:M48 family metallopeptidase [Halobacterium jilantaiense]SEW06195.1 STE24 endopeptidase [Halobacterium jilantaiense]
MLVYHAVFLALVAGTTLFFAYLAALNVRHAERAVRERANWLADRIGVDDPEELLAYHRLTTAASQLESVVVLVVVLLALYAGVFGGAVEWVYGTIANDLLAGVVLFVGTVLALQVLSLPFDAVDTFGVETAFGFNEQSPALFARDKLVGTVVGAVFVAILGAAVLFTVQTFPEWWWVAATGVVVAFLLATQVLVPRVVMPLFYDFDPVEDGSLRDAVEDVFERAGFACDQVYVMNASSRSGHSNAFFTGFGRTKRVVLFDTLVEQMDDEEVQSVLAHELAHWKKGHIWQNVAASALQAAVLLFVASFLLDAGWLYGMFGVPEQPAAGLLLAGLWLQPLSQLTAPIQNKLWLANEREADAFAVDVMGGGESLADALADLTSENLGNPFPHPYYEAFHYQHPPVPERIRYLTESEQA